MANLQDNAAKFRPRVILSPVDADLNRSQLAFPDNNKLLGSNNSARRIMRQMASHSSHNLVSHNIQAELMERPWAKTRQSRRNIQTGRDLGPLGGYNPQDFNEAGVASGSIPSGETTRITYTANEQFADNIFAPNTFESSTLSNVSFSDAWSTPINVEAGLEYIVSDRSSVFVNAGYGFAAGNDGNVGDIFATVYEDTVIQAFEDNVAVGPPTGGTAFIPNQRIASFSYDISDLESYDVEVGARHYFNPLVKSDGFRTVTPFVGASVGLAFVNSVDVTIGQTQQSYTSFFNADEPVTFSVPRAEGSTQIYDSAVLPKGELNVGAEWQITPGFALAAETGVKVQLSRDYEDFVNTAGETIEGPNGDSNFTVPLTLRGSINF